MIAHWFLERLIVFLLVFAILAGFLIIPVLPTIYSLRHEPASVRGVVFGTIGIPAVVLNYIFASAMRSFARTAEWKLLKQRKVVWQILLWTSYSMGLFLGGTVVYIDMTS